MGRRNLPVHAASKSPERPGLGKLWPVWGVLIACVWIAFSPVLNNGFVDWDDRHVIVENQAFQGLGWEQIQYDFTTFKGGVYQPLGWLVQSFTYAIFGLDPHGYHLVSLLFHVVNVVLLHLLCVVLLARAMPEVAKRLGGALGWLCAVPVLLYAIHPLRVEAVAWASCQSYLPGITFSLLATLAYLRAHPTRGVFRRNWMIGSSVLIVLAALSQASAVVLPFVFLILDVYPLVRLGPECPFRSAFLRVLIEKVPILAFCLAFTAVAFMGKQLGVDPEVTAGPVLVARAAQAGFGAWFYLAKTAWPFGLTAYYPRPEGGNFQTPLFAACVLGLVVALSAAIWQRRRRPWLLATVAAYLLIASPYLGLVRVGVTLASDRYCYAPMMAWAVLGCAGLCTLAQRRWSPRVWLGAGAGTLVLAFGLMSLCWAQCRIWGSTEHLFGQALEHAAWSPELHQLMGSTLAEEGKFEQASAELGEALRLRPHDFNATYTMGALLDRRGEIDTAIAYFRDAMSLRPEDAMVHLSLGAALVKEGHIDEAITIYRQGIKFQPNFPNLHFNLGVALVRQRAVDQAITELTRAIELAPRFSEAYNILGGAYVLKGRLDDAVDQYRKALEANPADSASRIDLGLTLARLGRADLALAQLREATLRDPRNPEAHHVLAAVLVESRRIREAVAEYEEVLRLRPDHPEARAFLAMAKGTPGPRSALSRGPARRTFR
jgi:Flp pilus assembly protein TadD